MVSTNRDERRKDAVNDDSSGSIFTGLLCDDAHRSKFCSVFIHGTRRLQSIPVPCKVSSRLILFTIYLIVIIGQNSKRWTHPTFSHKRNPLRIVNGLLGNSLLTVFGSLFFPFSFYLPFLWLRFARPSSLLSLVDFYDCIMSSLFQAVSILNPYPHVSGPLKETCMDKVWSPIVAIANRSLPRGYDVVVLFIFSFTTEMYTEAEFASKRCGLIFRQTFFSGAQYSSAASQTARFSRLPIADWVFIISHNGRRTSQSAGVGGGSSKEQK